MRHEVKKISKMIDELMTYILHTWDTDLTITIKREASLFHLRLIGSNITISDEDLEKLRKKLTVKRKPELEEYYWQLSGETEDSNELTLIAMMSDKIEVFHDGKDLTIDVIRNFSD